jgi:hypothetical protein
MTEMIRIFIADDHAIVREGSSRWSSHGWA